MSKNSKPPKPAKVKRVRQLIPVNAVVWVPGTELPDQIQKVIDEKISKHMDEYDRVHADRLKDYRGPAPIELGKIVEGLHYQLSGVYFEHGIEAVGLFLQELKNKADTRLKNEEGTLELANTAFNRAYAVRKMLEDIIAGKMIITTPEKRYGFQPGGRTVTDMNLKKADHGETLVSKRSTN